MKVVVCNRKKVASKFRAGIIGIRQLSYLKNRDKYFQVLFVAAQQKLLDKEYGECIEVYNECLNLTPKNNPIYLSALIGLAKAYQNLMNKKMAIQYLEMAEKNIQKENYPQNLKASFYAVKKEIVNTFL